MAPVERGVTHLERLSADVRAAARDRRRLVPRGAGRWWTGGAPGDAVLDCAGGADALRIEPGDLVATAGAGCRLGDLDRALRSQAVWLALDPPGSADRTLGGALAAGGAGPLAALYGPPRDQVIGLTMVGGNGTVARTGGRVVKNVAGFDLAKALVGSHGGFGIIGEAHLRLRAAPEADATRAWTGALPDITEAAARVIAAGALPAACEVLSPELATAVGGPGSWTLLVRALGTAAGVDDELGAVAAAAGGPRVEAIGPPPEAWRRWPDAVAAPLVFRIGAEPAAWQHAVAFSSRHLDTTGRVSVTVPRGTVRVAVETADPDALVRLRLECAARGWPLTLERAEPATLAAVGVWGALTPVAERLTRALRTTFDPHGVFAVPLLAA